MIQRHAKNRLKAVESGGGIDWATAEACSSSAFLVWTVVICGMGHSRLGRLCWNADIWTGCWDGDVEPAACDVGESEDGRGDRTVE